MKINKYLSVLALASLLFGATSCSDYIDIDPENSVPEEKVDYTNLDNMYMPVSGVYAKVRTGAMHWVIWPLSTVRDGDIWSGKPDDQAQLVDFGNFNYSDNSFWGLNEMWNHQGSQLCLRVTRQLCRQCHYRRTKNYQPLLSG